MSLVNEAAKRGVKLSSNFVTWSRNEDMHQDNLRTIKEDRKLKVMNTSRNKIL